MRIVGDSVAGACVVGAAALGVHVLDVAVLNVLTAPTDQPSGRRPGTQAHR
jgi:hypothetical protein